KQLENYEREIELKDEMYEHLSEKYTNKDLYTWLKKETGKVYKTLFQLAAKVARKAEKCYHFEIGDTDMDAKSAKTFIKGSGVYWDGLHSGLLAGEKLLADLHAMEVAYLENDRNELEITRDIYLDELIDEHSDGDTYLTALRKETKCIDNFEIIIPESFFDQEFSHCFRRIRNVQLQIILWDENKKEIDPNAHRHLSAELSLVQNSLKVDKKISIENRIGIQTIATSKAHLEAGQFKFDFSKDKYCPFEGAGVDSTWRLTVPGITGTQISNVILTISYTARRSV
ncbi:MAG: hypothetical protein J5615_07780, partial [Fibrobacter sp.]|nr:hypothetical protein [Fibrobacter sp.]